MKAKKPTSWLAVQRELRHRISQREWAPGAAIPHEADLATQFGCARSTMNRALRGLADEGLLERRRKAGTRVALTPARQLRLEITILREEIENKGCSFNFVNLKREIALPPPEVRARLHAAESEAHLYLETLYLANRAPYALEERWINLCAVPQARDEGFETLSPNEWLVRQVPFDGGDFTFSALSASARIGQMLACAEGHGLFVLDRTTRSQSQIITSVRLIFHPGYRLHTEI